MCLTYNSFPTHARLTKGQVIQTSSWTPTSSLASWNFWCGISSRMHLVTRNNPSKNDLTFSSWSEDQDSIPIISSSWGNVQSAEGVSRCFVFVLECTENIPSSTSPPPHSREKPLVSYRPMCHWVPKPKPLTGKGVELLYLARFILLGFRRRPSNIKPKIRLLLPRRKWQNSCWADDQQWLLHGRIYVFTTKYLDF